MLSTNLSRNIVFTIDKFFYTPAGAVLANPTADNGGQFDANCSWKVPTNPLITSNIETILEDNSWGDLLERRANLMNLYESTKDPQAGIQLKNFMKIVIDAGLLALKTADELYWLDRDQKIQNEFSLGFCLAKGIDLAVSKLKLNRVIEDKNNPEAIAKEKIEETFNKQIRDRKKEIGLIQTNALKKIKKVKNKKIKS